MDVRQLESGVVVPRDAHPVIAPAPAGPIVEGEVQEIPDERRKIFLPPAKQVFEAEPGTA